MNRWSVFRKVPRKVSGGIAYFMRIRAHAVVVLQRHKRVDMWEDFSMMLSTLFISKKRGFPGVDLVFRRGCSARDVVVE